MLNFINISFSISIFPVYMFYDKVNNKYTNMGREKPTMPQHYTKKLR